MHFEMFDVTRLLGIRIIGSNFQVRLAWKIYFFLFHLAIGFALFAFLARSEFNSVILAAISNVTIGPRSFETTHPRFFKWKLNFDIGVSSGLLTITCVRYLFVHDHLMNYRKHLLTYDHVMNNRRPKCGIYRLFVIPFSLWLMDFVWVLGSSSLINITNSNWLFRLLNGITLLGRVFVILEVNFFITSVESRLKHLLTAAIPVSVRVKSFASLKGAVDELNEYCGVAIFCSVCSTFVTVVSSVQSSILLSSCPKIDCQVLLPSVLIRIFVLSYTLFNLALVSKSLRDESEHFHRHLYSSLMRESSPKEYLHDVLVRIHLAYRAPLQIHVWNIFPLDHTLLTQMLSGMCTYLVLLLEAQLASRGR